MHVEGGLGVGDGHIGQVISLGDLLLKLVQLVEVAAPAGDERHRVGVAHEDDLGIRVEIADLLHDGDEGRGGLGVSLVADLAHAGEEQIPGGILLGLGQVHRLDAAVDGGHGGAGTFIAQVAGQNGSGQLLALPVGGVAQSHDAGDEGVVGADLDGDDVGLADVVPELRVVVLAAGRHVHLGHLAVPDHVREVGSRQGRQAEVDGVVTVEAESCSHLADIAVGRVAMEVGSHIDAVAGARTVLDIGQTDAGHDAVAQCDVGELLVLGAISLDLGFSSGRC